MKEKNQIYKCPVCGYLLSEISSEIPDHCPGCLSGLHETDAEGEVCGGMLEPVGIWVKGDESFEIIQRCRLCGEMTSVEMTEKDSRIKVLSIQRATGTVRHDLFHKGKRATHAVIRERPLEKSLCHDLYSQDNDTPAWCGSAHRNGNG